MPTENSTGDLADQLTQARVRIAELESANARLRGEQSRSQPASLPPPSFILENITDAFAALDGQFRYTWVNSEAERLIGIPRDRLLGESLWDVFPFMAGSTFEQKCRRALAERNPMEFDNYNASWNRWFYNKVYPTTEGGIAIYWREITDQKRAQIDLRRQALVLDQVHDAIVAMDLEGCITHWNGGAGKMFGYGAPEVLGRHIALLCFEEDRDRTGAVLMEPLMRDGQCEIEIRNRRKSGEECYIRLSLSLLRDEENKPYGMLGVATDITARMEAERAQLESEERRKTEIEILKQAAQLARANDDLLHLAQAASHDLRAQLRTVTSFSQVLARTYAARSDEEGTQILTWIVNASARMTAMLDGLLQFATLAGRETRSNPAVPMAEAVAAAVENLRSIIQETGAVISCDLLPTVSADPSQMAELFQILIGNSLKYRAPERRPEVRISVQRGDREWVIAIHDNGIGFDPQYSERIFGLFQRLHTAEFDGAGVGLAICKRIVERHGGRINATATRGWGAVFSFSIPDPLG